MTALTEIPSDTRLVEVIDRLLDQGVVIRGELWLSVADIDLVFIGADVLISNPDSMGRDSKGRLRHVG